MKMILIDKNMNAVEVEITELNFRFLNIDKNKIVHNKNKRELNNYVGYFLKKENEEK